METILEKFDKIILELKRQIGHEEVGTFLWLYANEDAHRVYQNINHRVVTQDVIEFTVNYKSLLAKYLNNNVADNNRTISLLMNKNKHFQTLLGELS